LESRDVSWPHPGEVAAVGGDQGWDLQPVGNGHGGGIHKPQEIVNVKEFCAAREVSRGEVLDGDFVGGQRLGKPRFGSRAEPLAHQAGGFGNHRGGHQQRLALCLQEIANANVPVVVRVGERVESSCVEKNWHYLLLRTRVRAAGTERCG
jgi:hypothetical protein